MLPEISVVIPTRRRETRLAFALDALAGQTLDPRRFEVIVVRATAESLLTKPPGGLQVSFRISPVAGTAVQRNLGWRAARAPLVAFSDDDCRAAPDWLERLLDAVGEDHTILQGRTEPDPEERHLLHGLARTIEISGPGNYETCNIAYPRALLERMGGFDESIDFLGEDADLGARARRAGAELRFLSEAVVWHAVYWRNLAGALRDVAKRSSMPVIYARYPEQRHMLWLGVFTSPDHIRLLAAAGGLLAARRFPPAALAAYPYVRRRFDTTRVGPWGIFRSSTRLLAKATVDAAEILTLAAASVRHRALVL